MSVQTFLSMTHSRQKLKGKKPKSSERSFSKHQQNLQLLIQEYCFLWLSPLFLIEYSNSHFIHSEATAQILISSKIKSRAGPMSETSSRGLVGRRAHCAWGYESTEQTVHLKPCCSLNILHKGMFSHIKVLDCVDMLIQSCFGTSLLWRIFLPTCYEVWGRSQPKVTEILGCEFKLTNVHGFPLTILSE